MRENVIVAYRGAKYELGQWPYGYGIWSADDQEPLPLEWWGPTPEGWSAAWYRFAAMEAPGTITPVTPVASVPAAGDATSAHADTTTLPVDAATAAPDATTGPAAAPVSAGTASQTASGPADTVGPTPAGHGAYTTPRPGPFFGPSAGGFQGYAAATASQPGQVRTETAVAIVLSQGRSRLAAGLLAAGVVLGVIGLFPSYLGSSLASQAANLWPHLMYLAAWAVSAGLIFRGSRFQRTGALIATGASVVTFGLFLADVGYVISGGSSLLGVGLMLSLIGWLACAAGSVLAFGWRPAGWPRRPVGEGGVVVALIVAAIGVAVTFAPAWDKVTLPTGSGVSISETLGNAFSSPGVVIAGNVAVMLAVVAVVAVAALWRPARMGWALIAGAMVPMVGQVVSALAQLGQTTTAASLGVTPADAAQLGISTSQPAHTTLTAAFWLYCLFVLILLVACAWVAFGRDEIVPVTGHYGYGIPAGYATPHPASHGTPHPAGYGTAQPAAVPGSTGPGEQNQPDATGHASS